MNNETKKITYIDTLKHPVVARLTIIELEFIAVGWYYFWFKKVYL